MSRSKRHLTSNQVRHLLEPFQNSSGFHSLLAALKALLVILSESKIFRNRSASCPWKEKSKSDAA